MTAPPEKPADLPDLPIRVRIGLWSYPLLAVFFLCILSMGVFAARAWDQGLIWLAGAVVVALVALLWRGSLKTHRRMAAKRRWWLVEMSDEKDRLTFKWESQTLDDLAPRMPVGLYTGIVFLLLFLVYGLLIATSPNSQDGFTFPIFATVFSASAYAFLIAAYAGSTYSKTMRATLTYRGARLVAPNIMFTYKFQERMLPGLFAWANFKVRGPNIKQMEFSTGGVKIVDRITAKHNRGMIIPTRDPDQRRAIADWAASHNIPVTGDI